MSEDSTSDPGYGSNAPAGQRFWLIDWRGYWRDEVLKDFVKYAVQVGGALYFAIVFRLIPAGDVRVGIASVLAMSLYFGVSLVGSAMLWRLKRTSGFVFLGLTAAVVLATILVVRAGTIPAWTDRALALLAVIVGVNMVVLFGVTFVSACRAKGWRGAVQHLSISLACVIGISVGAYLFFWFLESID
jgi:hypothetical protein